MVENSFICIFCDDEDFLTEGNFMPMSNLKDQDFGFLGNLDVTLWLDQDGTVDISIGEAFNETIKFDKLYRYCPFCGRKLPYYREKEVEE